jgi:hypothetical protein
MIKIFEKIKQNKEEKNLKSALKSFNDILKTTGRIGGMPLVILLFSASLIVYSIYMSFNNLINHIDYIFLFACFLAIIGLAIYIFDTYWKRKQIISSLDQYNTNCMIVFNKYIESKGKVDKECLESSINSLRDILNGGMISQIDEKRIKE